MLEPADLSMWMNRNAGSYDKSINAVRRQIRLESAFVEGAIQGTSVHSDRQRLRIGRSADRWSAVSPTGSRRGAAMESALQTGGLRYSRPAVCATFAAPPFERKTLAFIR